MTNDAETSPEQLEYDLDHPENLTCDEISEYLKALRAARGRIADYEGELVTLCQQRDAARARIVELEQQLITEVEGK